MGSSTFAAGPRLAAWASVQHGAFTRAQALAAGYTAGRIERRVRAGAWVRVLPGVYRHAASPPTRALERWAAVLWAGPPCALSHTSAAEIWSIAAPRFDRVELVVPRTRAPRARSVVVHRTARMDAGDVARVAGIAVTSPARTLVDLAAVLDPRDLEIAVVGACARGLVTVHALRARALGTGGRPGGAALRRLLGASGSAEVRSSARMAG